MRRLHKPVPPVLSEDVSDRRDYVQSELDAVWKVALALDSEERSELEAEVMLWRICSAKSIPDATIRRAIREEWRSNA